MGDRRMVVSEERCPMIYVDPADVCYDGIRIAAENLAKDIALVCGVRPVVCEEVSALRGDVIAVGSYQSCGLIRELVASGELAEENVAGKWECHQTKLISYGQRGIDYMLAIMGSDKRGCIYGIYRLSRMIGVSPWVYFADVTPQKRDSILFDERVDTVSKEPSVKYRGIFINDESPSFTGWVYEKFGGLNEEMYSHVFELILRLNGNYLWPAMWGNIFSEEGKADKQANIRMADAYGVVMGTSHHEPMCRAGEEWRYLWKNYTDHYDWNFASNREGITNFWRDGIRRNKPYESVITVGMRGEADSALGGGLQYNIDLLKDIIVTQDKILAEEGLADNVKMLVVYKEVEEYWNGGTDPETGARIPGLKDWKNEDGTSPLDNTVIMLCEDNYGNVRSLPEYDRKGGWGMYYHFDYNGGPRGYMWLNVMQLEKTWEQLTQTYDYGVRDIWIVNVGDLKPMELPITYYMDLAYDMETYGTNPSVTPGEYYLKFVQEQFGYGIDATCAAKIAELLKGYCKLNAICKPEYMRENVYSTDHYKEAQSMLERALWIMREAELVREQIPEELADAFYQLVYYPAVASANVVRMYIYYAYHLKLAEKDPKLSNAFAYMTDKALGLDRELMDYYNNTMSGGKWKKMMSQTHIGYVSWNTDHAAPPVYEVKPMDTEPDQEALNRYILEDGVVRTGTNYVAMRASSCSSNQEGVSGNGVTYRFVKIPEYGREADAMKVYPVTNEFIRADVADVYTQLPYLAYEFTVARAGQYHVRVYAGPSNHLVGNLVQLRYAVGVGDGVPETVNLLPSGFISGSCYEWQWCRAVERNAHVGDSVAELPAGKVELRIYGVDPGLLVQKVVVYREELPQSYLGPCDDGCRTLE
ncbi:MAG: glycosyl hydrolase 115 family protein [Lachnospiraceae bacterium]